MTLTTVSNFIIFNEECQRLVVSAQDVELTFVNNIILLGGLANFCCTHFFKFTTAHSEILTILSRRQVIDAVSTMAIVAAMEVKSYTFVGIK